MHRKEGNFCFLNMLPDEDEKRNEKVKGGIVKKALFGNVFQENLFRKIILTFKNEFIM